jgi:hypothetical protein
MLVELSIRSIGLRDQLLPERELVVIFSILTWPFFQMRPNTLFELPLAIVGIALFSN